MSTSIVHVMTIAGDTASEIEAACESLLNRRVPCDENSFGSDDWAPADQPAIKAFCLSLIRSAHSLPIVYYSQFLDAWTTADSRFSWLEWPDGRRRQIAGDWFGIAFYPSEFSDDLLAQLARFRRSKAYRTQSEDRWFLDHMREAISSALWLETPFLVVAISQHLGPGRTDDEILAFINNPTEIVLDDESR